MVWLPARTWRALCSTGIIYDWKNRQTKCEWWTCGLDFVVTNWNYSGVGWSELPFADGQPGASTGFPMGETVWRRWLLSARAEF